MQTDVATHAADQQHGNAVNGNPDRGARRGDMRGSHAHLAQALLRDNAAHSW